MFALRSLARAAPRALPRATSGVAARLPALATVALRAQHVANFSVSARSFEAAESAEKLVAQLERELKFEEEASKEDQTPEAITNFLENSGFELVQSTGSEEVKLVKKIGDEQITVLFSIADLGYNNPLLEDETFEEEEEAAEQNKNAEETEDIEDDADSFLEPTPIRVQVVIEKPNKAPGAISVDITVEEGAMSIDNFYYFNKAAEAFASSAEVAHSRANVYAGPSFDTLDEELRDKAEAYLDDRGIDLSLAMFVGEYANSKEQAEYVSWMKNLTTFMRS